MKKTILSLLVLTVMGGRAMAGDKPVITVADVEVLPGETAVFAVNLTDGKADTYTAMTLNAQFPETGFTTTGTYTISSAWPGATGVVGQVNATGLATIPFASANTISGSAVESLVTVTFKVDESTPLGEYDVTLKETLFEYGLADKDYADDVTFKVTVTDRITLDEESTELPATMAGVNVKVKRTLKADVWNTLCLPFSMDETQLKAAFGDDVELGEFLDYESDGSSITVDFGTVDVSDGISENYPYLIKTSANVTEFNVDGVNIAPDEEGAEAVYETGKGKNKTTLGRFIGTLKAGTTIPADNLYLSDNKFYYSTGTTTIKGLRGYFWLQDFDSSAGVPALNFEVDGQVTKVDGIQVVTNDGTYYDLNGMKTDRPTKKGVYIRNGKKVVIK